MSHRASRQDFFMFRSKYYLASDQALEDQIWGVNFQRTIRRHNETAFWAPLTILHHIGCDLPRPFLLRWHAV